jgi:hypothetical protein
MQDALVSEYEKADERETSAGPLWISAPYQLVSWWDMEKFAAEKFCHICSQLAGMADHYYKGGQKLVLPRDRVTIANQLDGVAFLCNEIGLKVTALQIQANTQNFRAQHFTAAALGQILLCLGQALTSEMSTNLFMRIFPERAPYYEREQLFGAVVEENFRSAQRDIRAAGSCFAVDLNTACVMHLMRVLELGLNVLAGQLGVPFERQQWENIINGIEVEIGKINGPHAGAEWRTKRDFYSEAAKDFRYFKNAWRNHAMHVHTHYDPHEAALMFDHVKSFMMHLAENGLREKPST